MSFDSGIAANGNIDDDDDLVTIVDEIFRLIVDVARPRAESRPLLIWVDNASVAQPISLREPGVRRIWDGSTRDEEDWASRRAEFRDLINYRLDWDRQVNQLVFPGLHGRANPFPVPVICPRGMWPVGVSDASRYGAGYYLTLSDNTLADGMSAYYHSMYDSSDRDSSDRDDDEMPELVG